MDRKIFGHIDCPTCGYTDGMRITADKSGQPFGFCEANCNQQLRIGGSGVRVRMFMQRYPKIAAAMQPEQPENPVTVTEPEPPKIAAPVKKETPKFNMGL